MSSSVNNDRAQRGYGWRAAYMLAALVVYLADQSSKAWVVKQLRFGDGRTII